MEDAVRQAYDAQRNFKNKAFRSGCYAPFVSLYLNTYGEVMACCKNWTYTLGNVGEQRLKDIWKGRKINTLRQSLANYRFGAGCEFCQWQIESKNYGSAFTHLFEEFPVESMDPEWPSMIEFAGSNFCNFECVMCSGEFSSLIRSRREGLPPLPKVYNDQFFEDLREFLPHLRQAKFLGGEPFLAPECFRIWDMVLEAGLTFPCHVTTNGSQYNEKVERVLKALPVSITVSVDGATKETVEKIRINADFDECFRNIRRFRDYTKRLGTFMSLAHCLMRPNWHEFGDLLLFAESLDCEVFVNTVTSPPQHSLYTLPPEELGRIADEMEKQGVHLKGRLRRNQGTWDTQIQNLRNNVRGRMSEKLGKVQKAIFDSWQDGRGNHVVAAQHLIRKGRYVEALEEALKASPADPFYYYSLVVSGSVRHLMGDPEGAEKDLDRALQMSRKRPEAFMARAWLRLDQGKLTEGVEDAIQARNLTVQGDEFEADLRELLGFLYCRQGKLEEATRELDRFLELKPSDPAILVRRGEAFRSAGFLEQAAREASAALALDPNHSAAIELKRMLTA